MVLEGAEQHRTDPQRGQERLGPEEDHLGCSHMFFFPGQSSLSAGALRYRARAQSWSSAALAVKLIAMDPYEYFQQGWNIFDSAEGSGAGGVQTAKASRDRKSVV